MIRTSGLLRPWRALYLAAVRPEDKNGREASRIPAIDGVPCR